jgi:hypothetical protein
MSGHRASDEFFALTGSLTYFNANQHRGNNATEQEHRGGWGKLRRATTI